MNTKDYTYLLNRPYSLNERQTAELENILSEFPFLQSARAIYLKGLYNQDSFRYNTELRKTAAYTTDRSVLFEFITSEQFQSIDKQLLADQEKALQSINVNDGEIVEVAPIEEIPVAIAQPVPKIDKLEESIKNSIQAAEESEFSEIPVAADTTARLEDSIKESIKAVESIEVAETPLVPEEKTAEEKLEIGKPLEFSKQETHSFAEWLQLSKFTPIDRSQEAKETQETEEPTVETEPEQDDAISKKMELIDRFIENNPKITPVRNPVPAPANIERSSQDSSMLMTETLARVYLEQKKYSKAIQAYEILILKYPEKSVFFADRISDIKIIQQNNNLKNDA